MYFEIKAMHAFFKSFSLPIELGMDMNSFLLNLVPKVNAPHRSASTYLHITTNFY